MARTVFLDGAWLPEDDAKISVFDRGFLFADAVYEVTAVVSGKLIDYAGHAARLQHSLAALGLRSPVAEADLLLVHREIVARNGLDEGLVYLQISRGRHDRDFLVPVGRTPTIVLFTQVKSILANAKAETGLAVTTAADGRWTRRDIKTVQLLHASLAKTDAHASGADDVFLVEDGMITEASSANVYMVTPAGGLVTRHRSSAILHGITRASILELARTAGIPTDERAFPVDELVGAAEVFITSATNFVMPVVKIDGREIGAGRPGPITRRLRQLYIEDRVAHAI